MNKNSWQFSFHKNKDISFCAATILTAHYEHDLNTNEIDANALQCVHNLNKTQVKTAIKTALDYIKNNKG